MKKMLKFLVSALLVTLFAITLFSCGEGEHTHTPGASVKENEVVATCENEGSYDEVIYCSGCTEELSRNTKTVSKLNHNSSDWIVDKVATCSEKGSRHKVCSLCNQTIETEVLETIAHDIVSHVAKAPTCTEVGWDAYDTCSKCDYTTYKEKETVKHEFSLYALGKISDNTIEGFYKCENCENRKTTDIEFSDVGLPIVIFNGSLEGVSKDNKVKISVDYFSEEQSFATFATLKVQGASSAFYPKKNFTIQFFKDNTYDKKEKITLNEDWGQQSKYCMKANWIDASHARNIVSGRIYNEILHSSGIEDQLYALKNGGVVDGYPVIVYNNNEFLGLYTMNIPKDEWMFGMDGDETAREAMLMANSWSDSVKLYEPLNENWTNGWELEYASTEDSAWVIESFNNLIAFLNEKDGQEFKDGISQYLDVERAIDNLIYTLVINGGDNVAKNILWVTYDGVRWTPSMYDMDGTWGLFWNGLEFYDYDDLMLEGHNALWDKLLKLYKEEIICRYFFLRQNALSLNNVEEQFKSFFDEIPTYVYETEKTRWENIPSVDVDFYEQIITFFSKRIAFIDEQIMSMYQP